MAQTFGFMLYVLDLGLESQVVGLGLGLMVYVLGLAICVLDSITGVIPSTSCLVSRVGFSASADRMVLFSVGPNAVVMCE